MFFRLKKISCGVCVHLLFVFVGFVYPVEPPPSGTILDKRLIVTRPSFIRSYQYVGGGEKLEVILSIINREEEVHNLRILILGLYEHNKVDTAYRQKIAYPTWRKRDFEQETWGISMLDSVPELPKNILPTHTDPYFTYKNLTAFSLSTLKQTDLGVPIKVLGVPTNQAKITETKDIYIAMLPRRTDIRAELQIRYPAHPGKLKFFNRLGIILYDATTNKITYRCFYSIDPHI